MSGKTTPDGNKSLAAEMTEAMNDPLFVADLREVMDDFRDVDFLDLESIRERSQLTEEQAAALADEVNRKCWEVIKCKFIDGEQD